MSRCSFLISATIMVLGCGPTKPSDPNPVGQQGNDKVAPAGKPPASAPIESKKASDTNERDDAPPADLSAPRSKVVIPKEGQVLDSERKGMEEFLRSRAEIVVIEGMPGVTPPSGAKVADPDRSSWTRRAQLRPWLQKAGIGPFKGGRISVKVVVGRDAWKLDEKDLGQVVSASVAALAEGKPLPLIDYQYPPELPPLQKAYEEAVRGGNKKIEGVTEKFLLIEVPNKTARMIEAMLVYGFDALFIRSDPTAWNADLFKHRLDDFEQSIQMYFTLRMTGLVNPYVLQELNWNAWTLPTPTLDRSRVIRAWFSRNRPGLRSVRSVSFSTRPGDFTVIEIGAGKHFHYSRFIAPVDDIPPAALALLRDRKYPIKQPEYYFSSRWWFANVVWQIAEREHRYIDFDPKTFVHGQPRMAWYPIQYMQFGPP